MLHDLSRYRHAHPEEVEELDLTEDWPQMLPSGFVVRHFGACALCSRRLYEGPDDVVPWAHQLTPVRFEYLGARYELALCGRHSDLSRAFAADRAIQILQVVGLEHAPYVRRAVG